MSKADLVNYIAAETGLTKAAEEHYSQNQQTDNSPITNGQKVGRNEACPCGSGKKYKHCCGKDK